MKMKQIFRVAAVIVFLQAMHPSSLHGAQSTYTGGDNKTLTGGVVGPLNLGDRARYGVVQLRANQEFTYDDNLFLSQAGRTNDFVSITSPGIYYRLGEFKNNAIEVGYDVNLIRFFDYSEEDGEEHAPYLRSAFTLGKTKLRIGDRISSVKGGSARGLINETTARVLKSSNDAKVESESQLDDKVALGFFLHHYHFNPQGAVLERAQIDAGATCFYKAFAKVEVYLAGDGGHVEIVGGDRQDFGQARIGFRGPLSPTMTARFDIGSEHRTSSQAGVGDQDNPTIEGTLNQAFTPDFKVNLRTKRAVNVSISTPGQTMVASTVDVKLDYQFGPVLEEKTKTRKLGLTLTYGFENDDSALPTNGLRSNVDIHTISPSVEYRVQEYWKLYMVYRYQELESNAANSNYYNHRVSLGSAVFF